MPTYYIGKPPSDLMHCIELCWSEKSTGKQNRSFYEVYPDSNVKLVFRFSRLKYRMVLVGPITEKATIEIDHTSDYFGFRFHPGQAPRIVDVKEADMVDRTVDVESIAGKSVEALSLQLSELQNHEDRQSIMENLIRTALPSSKDERCLLAAESIRSQSGQLKISELAYQLGIHVRTLERLFQNELGLSPKKMIRHVRLRKVMEYIYTGTYNTLGELAYTCGYADQSHMIREFKELTGKLPGDPEACDPMPIDSSPSTRIIHRYRP